jgi:hypothetical protein
MSQHQVEHDHGALTAAVVLISASLPPMKYCEVKKNSKMCVIVKDTINTT